METELICTRNLPLNGSMPRSSTRVLPETAMCLPRQPGANPTGNYPCNCDPWCNWSHQSSRPCWTPFQSGSSPPWHESRPRLSAWCSKASSAIFCWSSAVATSRSAACFLNTATCLARLPLNCILQTKEQEEECWELWVELTTVWIFLVWTDSIVTWNCSVVFEMLLTCCSRNRRTLHLPSRSRSLRRCSGSWWRCPSRPWWQSSGHPCCPHDTWLAWMTLMPAFILQLTLFRSFSSLLLTFFCTCSSLRLGVLFNFFCTCLPCCWECSSLSRWSALLSSITLFWASHFFAVNNPFSLTDLLASCHQDHPSVRAHPVCWLELCSLSGVTVCECVSLAPPAPYTFRLRSVVPWFVKDLHPNTTRSELSLHFGMVMNSAVPRLWPLWCVAGNTSSLEPPLRRRTALLVWLCSAWFPAIIHNGPSSSSWPCAGSHPSLNSILSAQHVTVCIRLSPSMIRSGFACTVLDISLSLCCCVVIRCRVWAVATIHSQP